VLALARRVATDWHDGQNFASCRTQIIGQMRASCSGKRGGRASSRTRDGMWWTQERRRAMDVAGRVEPRERWAGVQDERRLSVRQNRVVLTPRCWRQVCGFNLQMTVTNKPDHRGERGISRKAITQGMPGASAEPVCSCAHPHSSLRTRPRVQRASGIPCALPFRG
jgi:hypothetical protein